MYAKNNYSNFAIFFMLLALVSVIIPGFAFADGTTDPLVGTLCNVVKLLQGGLGKAVATIAIIALGLGLFAGKLSWPVALTVALGIGIIFGATQIVTWISSGTTGGTTCGV